MTTPKTYRAAISVSTHEIATQEREIPKPQQTQVLVRMEAAGICASDLHLIRRVNPYLTPTVDIGGHEGVGRIAGFGPDVDTGKWSVGDRVAVRWLYSVCQDCELCQSDNEALCGSRVLGGLNVDGCWGGAYISVHGIENRG